MVFLGSLASRGGLDKVSIKRPTQVDIMVCSTPPESLHNLKIHFALLFLTTCTYVYLRVGICMGFQVPVEATEGGTSGAAVTSGCTLCYKQILGFC